MKQKVRSQQKATARRNTTRQSRALRLPRDPTKTQGITTENGGKTPDMRAYDDEEIGVEEERERKRVKGAFRLRSLSPYDHGTTNDEIHSRVDFCPVMKAIMDTPQVQRLRYLKQLGMAEYAYMNVNHNRFEHSVGVAHLAERMCRRLQTRQPNLKITDKDVLCVKLAGLCHDLGHGPFSHVFCEQFPKALQQHLDRNPDLRKHYEGLPDVPDEWKHEHGSLMMIDAALETLGLAIDEDNLDRPLRQIGDGIEAESMAVYSQSANENSRPKKEDILTSRDWIFVKECILGHPIDDKQPLGPHRSGFVGRPFKRHEFLYDIVANRHTGLDVDKIDYFARDGRRAEGGAGEIEVRMIDEAVVAWGKCPQPQECHVCKRDKANPELHLMVCYPEKMDRPAMEFFHTRFKNHQKIYSHKTCMAATFMITDILTYADPFFRIPTSLDSDGGDNKSEEPKELPISRAMLDKTSFLRLRDSVIDQIMATSTPDLKKARIVIERLWGRRLYKCAGRVDIDPTTTKGLALSEKDEQEIKSEILLLHGKHSDEHGRPFLLDEEDIIVEKSNIHHGKKAENPVLLMRFLPKRDLPRLTRGVDDPLFPVAQPSKDSGRNGNTPTVMQEQFVRVYCRDSKKLDLLRHVFELWERETNDEMIITEEVSDDSAGERVEPVTLTQEEDSDTLSPVRNGSEQETSPFHPGPTYYR